MLNDRKIQDWTQAVSSLADKPQMTAAELKAAFDGNANQVKPALNGLIDDLQEPEAAGQLGFAVTEAVNAETVQAAVELVQAHLEEYAALLVTGAGAGLVGVTPTAAIAASTVQAGLERVQANLEAYAARLKSPLGAADIGVADYPDLETGTLQATLQGLSQRIKDVTAGMIPDYGVTWFKLAQEVRDAIDAGVAAVAAHDVDENAHADILGDLTILLPEVVVSTQSGAVVAATLGDISVEATAVGGVAVLALPAYGVWEISVTHGVKESDPLPLGVDAVKQYEVVVAFADVVGVCWHYGNASTALERLTRATDPHGLVSVDIEAEPSPAVGTGAGSSPFDDVAPWSGVREYNVIGGVVSYEKGEAGFSRTSNDTVVHIPAYYYRVVDDAASSKRYFYISNKPKEGFVLHPGSGRYVGKYNTISGYFSKSGAAPLASIGRPTARTGSRGKGAKWHMYDYATWCAIWLLYLVEFADWDSQTKIGKGYTDGNAAAINTGGCDAMVYHTGRAAGTDGKTAVQYRWMENLWGNVRDWVDGVNFNERLAYICLNPAQYADDTATNYISSGVTLPASGWTKMLGYSAAFPWAFLPSENGGSDSSHIPDYVASYTGWRALIVGGGWSYALNAGLFYADASNAASSATATLGARLLFVP